MSAISYADVNEDVLKTLERPKPAFYLMLIGSLTALVIGGISWAIQIDVGLGLSGISHPVGWGVYITNFVFWIGIGHAGTLISAVFFLTRAPWRAPVYRAAEAMTVFAVMTAGMFPLLHVGRVWYAYWLIPFPNQRMLWVNFKSPLLWDVFAVSTYLTISVTFFIVGLIPDLAAMRDKAKNPIRRLIYWQLSAGWNNSYQQWLPYMRGYLILAAFATPLVFSVHSIVSWDFAMSLIPGWHTTIFAPYFVAGAIFSGLAMVITIVVPMRLIFGWEKYITDHVLQSMAKVILFTSVIVGYAYSIEFFIAWYSGVEFERALFYFRAFGEPASWAPYGEARIGFPTIAFWLMVFCNVVSPLPLWRYKIRTNAVALFIISILINIGMWFERFNIVVSSLQRDFMPANWNVYWPTIIEWGITLGSFGFFFTLFTIFTRSMPGLAIAEVKEGIEPPLRNPAAHH